MDKNLESPFGTLKPNTPAKALFWINSIILLSSLYFKPIILSSYHLMGAAVFGITFSLYLWYIELVKYPLVELYNKGQIAPINVWGNFLKNIKVVLLAYIILLIVFSVLMIYFIKI